MSIFYKCLLGFHDYRNAIRWTVITKDAMSGKHQLVCTRCSKSKDHPVNALTEWLE